MLAFFCHHCGCRIEDDFPAEESVIDCPKCSGRVEIPWKIQRPDSGETAGLPQQLRTSKPPAPASDRKKQGPLAILVLLLVGAAFGPILVGTFSSERRRAEWASQRDDVKVWEGVGLPSATGQKRSTGQLVQELRDDMSEVRAAATDERDIPHTTDLRLDAEARTPDDAGKLAALYRLYVNGTLDLQNAYLKELMAFGGPTLISPARIAKDRDFKESRTMIRKYRETGIRCQTAFRDYMKGFASRFDELDIDSKRRIAAKDAWEEGMARALTSSEEIWEIERISVLLLDKMIDHLEATRSDWAEEDDRFLFESQASLDKYNEIMGKLFDAMDRQTKIREDVGKSAEGQLREIERMFGP